MLKMIAGSCYVLKKRVVYPHGDDAHFIYSEKGTIGASDGVGNWVRSGIDPGEYARGLMTSCADEVGKREAGRGDLESVLNAAFDRTLVRGSATTCLLTLADDGEGIYRSPIQQHFFNCPYQRGREPRHCSSPGSAQGYRVEVREGDIIVAGTDGLSDNLFVEQIKDVAEAGIREGKDLWDIASSIAARAHANSLDKTMKTPLSEGAEKHGKEHRGGKADDITVIVPLIVRD